MRRRQILGFSISVLVLLLTISAIATAAYASKYNALALNLNGENARLFIEEAQEDPGSLLLKLGSIAVEQEQVDIANQLFERAAADTNPRVAARAYHNLGVLAYWSGEKNRAAEFFTKANDADASYAHGQYSKGIVEFELEHYSESVTALRKYTTLASNDAHGHFDLGVALASELRFADGSMENLEEAEQHFEKALSLDPKFPHAQNNLDIIRDIRSQMS